MTQPEKTYTDKSDEELMIASAKGDTQAFGYIYDRYQGKLTTYFFRMLWQDREKANDMTHELFSKIIHKPQLYKKGKKFSTWIYAIASNMCKNEYRRAGVRKEHSVDVQEIYGGVVNEDTRAVDHQRFKEELDVQIGMLNVDQRAVFIMRFKQDLSIKEIADVLDCSEGTVKSRIFYTLKKLSKGLEVFDPNYQR